MFFTKFSKISAVCEGTKDLMVAIFLVDQSHFLYCSKAFKKVMGENYHLLMEQGWSYWFSFMNDEEISLVKKQLLSFFKDPLETKQLILTYHFKNFLKETICIKQEVFLYQLKSRTLAINYFFDVTEKERIKCCLHDTLPNTRLTDLSYYAPISEREKEVLKLVADGYSSKQIADQLYISNHTAISHRKNLMEKFHVKNAAQLIKKASKILEL